MISSRNNPEARLPVLPGAFAIASLKNVPMKRTRNRDY